MIRQDTMDLGALAEAIVYYGKVNVSCFDGHLISLIERIGIDNTIRLAESEIVDFSYRVGCLCILDEPESLYPHDIYTIARGLGKKRNRTCTLEEDLNVAIKYKFGSGALRRKDIDRLVRALQLDAGRDQSASKYTNDSIKDQEFIQSAIRKIIQYRIPDYPFPDRVSISSAFEGSRFNLSSNIDYHKASELFSSRSGHASSTITPGVLLAPLMSMCEILLASSELKQDVWIDPLQSKLIQLRVNLTLRNPETGRVNIDRFNEKIFVGKSFAGAVSSGERHISEILDFAEREDTLKFKRWIADSEEGADLLAEYEKSKVSASRLASSLPAKAVRIVLFATAGAGIEKLIGGSGAFGMLAGPIVSEAVLSAADDLILSRIKLGWKPNQWVVDEAGPFLRGM